MAKCFAKLKTRERLEQSDYFFKYSLKSGEGSYEEKIWKNNIGSQKSAAS